MFVPLNQLHIGISYMHHTHSNINKPSLADILKATYSCYHRWVFHPAHISLCLLVNSNKTWVGICRGLTRKVTLQMSEPLCSTAYLWWGLSVYSFRHHAYYLYHIKEHSESMGIEPTIRPPLHIKGRITPHGLSMGCGQDSNLRQEMPILTLIAT